MAVSSLKINKPEGIKNSHSMRINSNWSDVTRTNQAPAMEFFGENI